MFSGGGNTETVKVAHKSVSGGGRGGGIFGGLFASAGVGGGLDAGASAGGVAGGSGVYRTEVKKVVTPGLINDALNVSNLYVFFYRMLFDKYMDF